MSRAWALLCCLAGLPPASLAGQARIEAILPAEAPVTLSRLGADRSEAAAVGMELAPGDLLDADADGVSIGLTCSGPEGTNTYLVTAPFRLLIDVPTQASCHVNLLSGLTEVVAEAPTETTAGGVTLGSTGTQYAVELRRRGSRLVFNCFVYDDSVRVLSYPDLRASAGEKMVWSATSAVTVQPNTPRDLARSAQTYARFDLARMTEAERLAVQDTALALRTLTALHMDVLAHPADTAKRVALAKEQIRYDARDQAMYNLRRVDVGDSAQFRRYAIDPSVLSGRVSIPGRRPQLEAAVSRDRMAPRQPGSTTDTALRLIDTGRIDEAIGYLQARVESGRATSRDEYALAKAFAARGDLPVMRAHAGRALVLHADDGGLSAAELRELGGLIGRY